jgi:Pyruvate/2-oxoglutarate dehydrogenase complex, dihydrolipoamide acyltransferase (E2) component, and related enzymes
MPGNEAKTTGRRLFSRTEIPMRITLGGHLLPVLNWSLGGLALAKPCPISLVMDETIDGVMELLVGGVDLSVKVTLRLANEQDDRLGFAFVGISPEQMGMLRALLVRGGGSPLERAPLPAPAGSPAGNRTRRASARGRIACRWFARAAVVVVLLSSFGAIGAYALVKQSIVQSAEAAVAIPTELAVSVDRGYVDKVLVQPGDAVTVGQPLVSLRRRAEPAKAVLVNSPCACNVVDVLSRPGDDVVAGEPLLQLSTPDRAEPFVEALVPAAVDVQIGQNVKVAVEGSSSVGRGRVTAIEASRAPRGRFGLPDALRKDPRYQLVIVSDLTGLRSVNPGAAARLQLSEDTAWSERLKGEVTKLGERARRILTPSAEESDGASG